MGLSKYIQAFKKNHITGATLREISEKEITEDLGMKDSADLKKFLRSRADIFKIMPSEGAKIAHRLADFYESNKNETYDKTAKANHKNGVVAQDKKGQPLENLKKPKLYDTVLNVDTGDEIEDKIKHDSSSSGSLISSGSSSDSAAKTLESTAENGHGINKKGSVVMMNAEINNRLEAVSPASNCLLC